MRKGFTVWLSVLGMLGFGIILSSFLAKDTAEADNVLSVVTSFNANYEITMPPIPNDLEFCMEKVPLDEWEVKERIEREMLSNTYWQSNTVLLIKRSGRFFDVMERILAEEGVPQDFKYLAVTESGLLQTVSPAGARGIWQFMPPTAKTYGLEVNDEVDERYHVEKSTRAACQYLKHAKEELGSWTLAAAAYNRGVNGILRDLKKQRVENYYDLYLNTETSRYIFRILAFKLIMENPRRYGFIITDEELYNPIEEQVVTVDKTIEDLAEYAQFHGTNYKTIKLLNPWLRSNSLTISEGQSYQITLPAHRRSPLPQNR